MMPEWNKFHAAHKNDPKVDIFKVNGSQHPGTANKYEVRGFPTVIKVKDGVRTVFKGERTAKALEQFLKA